MGEVNFNFLFMAKILISNLCHFSITLVFLLKNEGSTHLSALTCYEPKMKIFEGHRMIQSILFSSTLFCCL